MVFFAHKIVVLEIIMFINFPVVLTINILNLFRCTTKQMHQGFEWDYRTLICIHEDTTRKQIQ